MAEATRTERRTSERSETVKQQPGGGKVEEVFDPSKTPAEHGGTPKGEVPGEQAGGKGDGQPNK